MIQIYDNLKLKIGVLEFMNLEVSSDKKAYKNLIKLGQEYYEKYSDVMIGKIKGVQFARQFFKDIGIDPTKHRPSSEALLRRAVRKKEFYSVNNLVDVSNWCSLEFLLPICVYDMEKISGNIYIRMGKHAEEYIAINNNPLNLNGRYVVADEISAFGSPIFDSKRTAVDFETSHSIMFIFAPSGFSDLEMTRYLNIYKERIEMYCGGELIQKQILSSS